jgi:hypothetical protein
MQHRMSIQAPSPDLRMAQQAIDRVLSVVKGSDQPAADAVRQAISFLDELPENAMVLARCGLSDQALGLAFGFKRQADHIAASTGADPQSTMPGQIAARLLLLANATSDES